MSVGVFVLLSLAGGLGSVGRVVVSRLVARRVRRHLFVAIMTVNLTGSLALGVLSATGLSRGAELILATGLLGGYTTFSTWMLEAATDAAHGRYRYAILNVAVSVAGGVAMIALGWGLADLLGA